MLISIKYVWFYWSYMGFGRFVALRFSCVHVIAASFLVRLDQMSFVNEVYKLQHIYNVWGYEFPPIPNESVWSSVSSAPFKLLSNSSLRRKPIDRLKSTRIRDNMDIWERKNQSSLCNYCRNPGYVMPSCPHQYYEDNALLTNILIFNHYLSIFSFILNFFVICKHQFILFYREQYNIQICSIFLVETRYLYKFIIIKWPN